MNSHKEGEPQTLEVQQKEPLTINLVLDSVYKELVSGFEGTPVICKFEHEFHDWDSFHDINGTRHISFKFSGVLFELEENRGLLVVKSDERETSWFSSLIKVVAWTKLEIGGDGKYKVQIRDYPSWDEIPTERMIHELPKDNKERSFRNGGILVNQGQRLALNGVILMQKEFVAQKETINPNVVRGPGGVPILLDRPRSTDQMYQEDVVTLGTAYRPEIVSWLVEEIRKDFSRKLPRK